MISVCMAVHNGERYIREQIASILSQLAPEDELIISDDGSTDRTLDEIQSFCDPRIKFYQYKLPENVCPSEKDPAFIKSRIIFCNFMNSIMKAKGDYIFLSDQDDIWKPEKVSRCISALQSCNCLVHSCEVFGDSGDTSYISPRSFQKYLSFFLVLPNLMGCCMAFRRDALFDAVKKCQEIDFPIEHDTWLALCAIMHGGLTFLNEPLIRYRRHGNNASILTQKIKTTFVQKWKRRWRCLRACVLLLK